MMAGYLLAAGVPGGQVFRVFGQSVTERITAEQSGGASYVFEEISPPGTGVPPHRHLHEDEIVQVLEGRLEVTLDSVVSVAEAGAILHLPRGSVHGFRNSGPADARTLWVVPPGANMQALFRILSTFPEGPPDLDRLAALNTAHGIETVMR
jgi:quercetin dioxygenase-like cupin family protein